MYRTLQVGATGDIYLLTERCDGNGPRYLLGIRGTNGGVFLSRTVPVDAYALDVYREGLVLTGRTFANPPDLGHDSVYFYGYDGTPRRVVDLPSEALALGGAPTDMSGNTYAVVRIASPSGVSCQYRDWAATLVRVSPNGEVRQTPLNLCGAYYGYASPDGVLIGGYLSGGSGTLTKLDRDAKSRWQYRSDRAILADYTTVGGDGNIVVDEIRTLPDGTPETRVLVLDGRSGEKVWSWSSSSILESHDRISSWRIANGRIYLKSARCDETGSCSAPTVSAYDAPVALDYPRSDLLAP
ncbi:hypothetical protein GA0070614_0561 [Micromonospora coxensis]|uniref:PQQ-like domain-containing protein n=2 Tax=Micromonospora coxensis TaxID=356852 RepID=A0A1C5GYD3_9ACTN|nr:hypothetical protein GA0070614_0561 [Micromonospora coxensis]